MGMESLTSGLIVMSVRAVLHYIFYRLAVSMIFTAGKGAVWFYEKFVKTIKSTPCDRTGDYHTPKPDVCSYSSDDYSEIPLYTCTAPIREQIFKSFVNKMTNLMGETFATITHRDFTWPYQKPLVAKPVQPPMNTGARLYMAKVDPNDCRCDAHGFMSDMNRYKQLADKERRLHDDVVAVNREMTNLMGTILENVCEMGDETMRSVYQTDYEKRGLPIGHYRQLMAAVDSPVGAPINPVVTDLRNGYRDPTRFRYSAIDRPTIQPAKTIDFLAVPETFEMWGEPFTGRSEYMDNFSKMGLSNMKNRQQYLEPIPSSRRRYGDCKL